MAEKIGLGGGCHWCTEGIFQSLIGVAQVDQGWITSNGDNATPSEAVIVHFNPGHIFRSTHRDSFNDAFKYFESFHAGEISFSVLYV
jgi:hypothetical protein